MVAGVYLPLVGGYIKIINELAVEFVRQGYVVDILTSRIGAQINNENYYNINVYRLSSINLFQGDFPIPLFNYSNMRTISDMSRNDYHCIITNTRFYPICFVGWLLSRLWNIPLFHLEHGSQHTVSDSSLVSMIGKLYDHSIGRLLVKSAVQTFGVSISAVDFLGHLGAKRTKIMHNGINLDQYRNGGRGEKSPKHDVTITYVGRLIYAKGVQDLLSVLPDLKGEVHVQIVGDGPYRPTLEKMANEVHNIQITFLGEQSPEFIPGILQKTDIFVSPSYSEGLPTSVLEACAAGCAVIATDVGGTKEIIIDGKTGMLFEPGNKNALSKDLNYLVQNKKLRDSLGRNAKEHVSANFSWDCIMKLWIMEMECLEGSSQSHC